MNAQSLVTRAAEFCVQSHRVPLEQADARQLHDALTQAIMADIAPRWLACEQKQAQKRRAYYLSAEYLTGRLIYANLFNLGVLREVRALLMKKGVDLAVLEDIEDAALGNGGLGRLAACFLDSAATHDKPLTGYGLRYRYGLFKQAFENGAQKELPDDWTACGDPWSVRRDDLAVTVPMKTGDVRAVPYDMPVIGYDTDTVLTLRLWQTESLNAFDFDKFNNYRYAAACADKNRAEDITKVLYPNDWSRAGKQLRIKQQYVLSSASMQDILRAYRTNADDDGAFADQTAIQLNDTHPVLAIPEFIRLMMKDGMAFEDALRRAKKVFAYTNHTVMQEALEKWDLSLLASVIPDIAAILRKIDAACRAECGMALIKDKQIHMADLAIYAGSAINGVAKLHTQLLKRDLFKDWYALRPDQFQNKTNGITQRRWLGLCNPELCDLIEKRIGKKYLTNLSELKALEGQIDDTMIDEFLAVKRAKKEQLSDYIQKAEGVLLPPEFAFDAQIKRLHEYKRQLMNAFSLYDLYCEMKAGHLNDFTPTAFLIGAKSAPGYARAKAIIRYLNQLAARINADADVNDKMRVVFVQNYNCSYAERIIPAADFSEQISPAGTEASGTGNMKLMLNGALTIGTYDGANIEIVGAAGSENNYIFGADIEEIERVRDAYDPTVIYEAEPRVKRCVDSLINAGFDDPDGMYQELHDALLVGASWHKPDHYFVLKDFLPYQQARLKAFGEYRDSRAFAKKCLINIVNAGMFSSDRTIDEYARDIWRI